MAIVPWEFENVQTISVSELKDKLQNIKGCHATSVVLATVPKMNKNVEKGVPNPYYGRVTKRAYYGILIGAKYENSVNNQLDREDKERTFEAAPRVYGEHVEGSAVIEYKGKYYLQCKIQDTLGTQFYVDGEPVEKDVVDPYIVKPKPSARQADAGVEKQVYFPNPLLTSIEVIKLNGETYTIAKEETAEDEVPVKKPAPAQPKYQKGQRFRLAAHVSDVGSIFTVEKVQVLAPGKIEYELQDADGFLLHPFESQLENDFVPESAVEKTG